MEIDIPKFKLLLTHVFDLLKSLDRELTAHRILVAGMKQHLNLPEIDTLLADARAHPGIAERIHKEYDLPLETLLHRIDDATLNQALEQFLKSWRPSGPVN